MRSFVNRQRRLTFFSVGLLHLSLPSHLRHSLHICHFHTRDKQAEIASNRHRVLRISRVEISIAEKPVELWQKNIDAWISQPHLNSPWCRHERTECRLYLETKQNVIIAYVKHVARGVQNTSHYHFIVNERVEMHSSQL